MIDFPHPFLFHSYMKSTKKKIRPDSPPTGLKSGMVLDLAISALNESGYGKATHNGFNILVNGALPGEQARVRIDFSGKREAFATAVKILRHSPQRLASPACTRLGSCDGCPLMLMKYPAQLNWKQGALQQEFARYRSLQNIQLQNMIPSPQPLHYRNSAKLVIAGRFAAPVIGIYRRSSDEIQDISDCPLNHPLINRIIAATKEGISRGKVPIYSSRTGNGLLRHLLVRVSESENQAMVVFVTSQRSFNELHHLSKHLQNTVPEISTIVQNINGSTGKGVLGEQNHFLTRKHSLPVNICDRRFTISPHSIFQVNSGSAEIICETVRGWADLTGVEEVVDLYCGSGWISLLLASRARHIYAIELTEKIVKEAENNARLNGIDNCDFLAGEAGNILAELRQDGLKIDLLIVSPGRTGCDSRIIKEIAALLPDRIIYLSSSPATLARDLDQLSRDGYINVMVQPVDMLPQTPHLDCIALLEKSVIPAAPH